MKNKKLLLLCLSLALLLVFASCDMFHDCSKDAEWKYDETHHWRTCGCGKEYQGDHSFGEWADTDDGNKERACTVCGYKEIQPADGEQEHQHDYSDSWSKDNNHHWHACSGCNVPSEKSEHDWDSGVVVTEPTCSENGVKTLTCKTCNLAKDVEIEKLPHSEETLPGKAATCTEDGLTDGKKCSDCGEIIVEQEEIPAVGHKDENVDYKCDVCESDLCTSHVAADAVKENQVAPTCTADGSYDNVLYCSLCGDLISSETVTVEKLGHTEAVDAGKAADCTNTGLTEGKHCSVCNEVLVAQEEIAALGHTEVVDAGKAADCTNTGLTEGKHCSVCNETLVAQEEIAALGHTEVIDAGKAADCTNTGLTEGKHCSVCNETLIAQEIISALGHKDENGDYKCDACGTDLCTNHTPGEAKEENRIEATCTADGSYDLVVKCSVCGEELSRESKIISKLGHTEETVAGKAPTCTEAGLEDGKKCSVCGEIILAQEEIPALGHTEEVISGKAPTCTETGLTEGKKCTVCGETILAQEEIPANGHDYKDEWANDENNHWHVCDVCGENSELATHSFDTGSIVENKIVCTCLCGYTTENAWDGETVSESLSGSGTEADPYLIQSGADLAYIKNHMTAEGDNFAGVYFKMSKSIDLGNHSMRIGQYPGWNANRRFFAGIFDGNNCSIINLNMTESGMGGGLFAVVTGTVKNLSVYGKVTGNDMMVGGIVGWLFNGTLENCNGYVDVISSGAGETGALVGTSENGKIINCVNYGSVVGVDSVGGIAGKASGTIENCVNNGTVNGCYNVGGIYGSQHHSGVPTLTNNTDNGTAEIKHALTHYEAKENTCEEAGNIEYYACSRCKKNFDADGNVLGTVEIAAKGHAWDTGVTAEGKITFTCGTCGATRVEDAKYTVKVNHLFLDGSVAAEADAIEFDYEELATINAKTIEGYVANNDYVKVEVLDNVTITIYYSELSEAWDGTSVTESLAALGGSGTADDPYIIDSGADLALIDQSMTVAGDNFNGVHFKMTKSIDLGGNPMNIGAYTTGWNNDRRFFTGIFDGNNCSVRNLDLDMTPSGHMGGGLFAVVKGTVKNLSVYGTVKAVKNMSAGIVGWLYNGTLENCTNYVQVTSTGVESGAVVGTSEWGTIKNCVNYGSIVGTDSVGAIAGKASGTISGCRNYGTYEGTSNVGEIYGSAHNNNHPTVTD